MESSSAKKRKQKTIGITNNDTYNYLWAILFQPNLNLFECEYKFEQYGAWNIHVRTGNSMNNEQRRQLANVNK